MEILVATHNRGKLEEMRAIARGWPVTLKGLSELGIDLDVEETGLTFDDNALIKARALFDRWAGPVLADDSGLCVDYLAGAPGIHTARFAGRGASDQANYRLLLDKLEGVPEEKRGAHFHCSLALVNPQGEAVYQGRTDGGIALEASGTGGFGYDPVFIPEGENRTLAWMSPEEKNAISHRGRALRQFLEERFPHADPLRRRR